MNPTVLLVANYLWLSQVIVWFWREKCIYVCMLVNLITFCVGYRQISWRSAERASSQTKGGRGGGWYWRWTTWWSWWWLWNDKCGTFWTRTSVAEFSSEEATLYITKGFEDTQSWVWRKTSKAGKDVGPVMALFCNSEDQYIEIMVDFLPQFYMILWIYLFMHCRGSPWRLLMWIGPAKWQRYLLPSSKVKLQYDAGVQFKLELSITVVIRLG